MSEDIVERLRSWRHDSWPADPSLEAAAEIERLRAELEKRTRNHRKLLQGLARGDYEIVYASDEGEVVAIFPVALYEDQHSDPEADERIIDRISNDPLVRRAGISFPQQQGREEQQRKIWRARLAQMRRVGIVISEGKP